MRVPNKPSIIRAHCIHFSTYTPLHLTFLILIQAARKLTVICLKNVSVCPPCVFQGIVCWIPLVAQTHVFIRQELISHCFMLSLFLKCLETTHLQDGVFRNNANVARRYTYNGGYSGKFCVWQLAFTASDKAPSLSRGTVGMATDTGTCSCENKHDI